MTSRRIISENELAEWKSTQQRSSDWYRCRNQLLTASDVPIILELSPYKTKYELFQSKLKSILNPTTIPLESTDNSVATEWGVKYEPLARSFYETMPLANGPRYIHEVGIVRHSRYRWLGASPDGVVQSAEENVEEPWWLLEIKCPYRRMFHDKDKIIPLYIWVQIQIQLEVCDLPFCHLLQCRYSDNSKLINRKLSTIRRDKAWFKEQALPVLEEFWELLQRATRYEYVTRPYPNPKEWVSMRSFTGHLLNDPILDWLNEYKYHSKIEGLANEQEDPVIEDRVKEKDNLFRALESSFKRFCYENGYKVITITPLEERDRESLSVRRFKQTKQALDDHTHVIVRPVLLNFGQKIYGIPDMLVRNDIALRFLKEKCNTSIDLGFLETSVREFKEPGYILFCLTLRSCVTYKSRYEDYSPIIDQPLLSSDDQECTDMTKEFSYEQGKYKVSPRVQSFAMPPPSGLRRSDRLAALDHLVYIDDNSSDESTEDESSNDEQRVIIRSWDKVLRARYAGYSDIVDSILTDKGPCTLVAFLGSWFCHIFNPTDIDYAKADVREGVRWMRVVKEKGEQWLEDLDVSRKLPIDHRLMPNMCNKYDQRWRDIKQTLAERWGELTLLWYCGIEQRRRAHKKGIYSWKDDTRSSVIVDSFYTDKEEKERRRERKSKNISRRRRIMGAMIRLNRTEDKVYRSYHTREYEEPYLDIPEKTKEFFVDFEVIPYNQNRYNSERSRQPNGMIYLIGLGWLNKNNIWEFRSYIASSLTQGAEKQMLLSWWKTIQSVKRMFRASRAVLYHWSCAEPIFLGKALERNPIREISDDLEGGGYEFRDMMEMFLDAEVVIRGVWGYSVKDIAKGLYRHGLLQEIWEKGEKGNATINSGVGTLATAAGCYKQASKYGIDILQVPQFSSLKEYNEMDCRVMYDLLLFLRNHIYAPRKDHLRINSPNVVKNTAEIWGTLPPPSLSIKTTGKKRSRTDESDHYDETSPNKKRRKTKSSCSKKIDEYNS